MIKRICDICGEELGEMYHTLKREQQYPLTSVLSNCFAFAPQPSITYELCDKCVTDFDDFFAQKLAIKKGEEDD